MVPLLEQLAVALLILFVAYALQVRYRPFMSPGDRAAVVQDHSVRAMQGGVHAVVAAAIKAVESRGRKAGRATHMRSSLGASTRVAAVVAGFANHFFNYNTVEMVLLFSATLVCLAGVMYESEAVQTGQFSSQRDTITAILVIVIVTSIVYCTYRVCHSSGGAVSSSTRGVCIARLVLVWI